MVWDALTEQFIIDLKRRQVKGSFATAKQTAELLRAIVSNTKWGTAKGLLDIIQAVGRKLTSAHPLEFTMGNVVRRVLFLIREEYMTLKKNKLKESRQSVDRAPSMYNLLDNEQEEYTEIIRELKASVIEGINELIEETKNCFRNIADQAIEHIHSNEVIMTFGRSNTVFEFLKAAARFRKFAVVVAESGPFLEGHKVAIELSQAGIESTLITDAAIFTMMARVNKVIIPTHAVMANGGLIASTGTHMLAVAAKHHSVPVMVCTGMYKLCPLYPYDQDTFNDFLSPGSIMRFEDADEINNVHIECPAFDYIPPELVDLFVTNIGGHNPSYIYRLLVEYYSPEDTFDDVQ